MKGCDRVEGGRERLGKKIPLSLGSGGPPQLLLVSPPLWEKKAHGKEKKGNSENKRGAQRGVVWGITWDLRKIVRTIPGSSAYKR